jgi:hypothetical protein
MFKKTAALAGSLLISGCASMPDFDTPKDGEHGPTVSTVVDEIDCEISEANQKIKLSPLNGMKDYEPFDKWTAAVGLTLTVDDSVGTANSGLPISYLTTLSKAATYTFGFNPTLYQLRTRTYVESYTVDIARLPAPDVCRQNLKASSGFNLEGDLGLPDQIYLGLHSFSDDHRGANYFAALTGTITHPTVAKMADTFGATVFFNVFYGVNNVGPTWTLNYIKGPTSGVGYVRNDIHQAIVTFAPVAKAVPKPAQAPQPGAAPGPAPTPKPKPAILEGLRPELPKQPLVEGEEMEAFRKTQNKIAQYDAAERNYTQDLVKYSLDVAAYNAKALAYQAQVARYNADVLANSQNAAAASAGDAARAANQNAATVQAVQSLSQQLSRP